MAMNDLERMLNVLETGGNEIKIDPKVSEKAVIPIQRMMNFASARGVRMAGKGNA
jgi:quinolinate synthase